MSTEQRPHDDIQVMMSAVEIHSPDRYTINGQLRDFSGGMPMAGNGWGPLPESPMFNQYLERDLYAQLYVRPSAKTGPAADYQTHREFISTLSAANNGTGSWESGWKIDSIDEDGRVAVSRDQVTFWAQPTGLKTRSGQIRPGDFCRVWVMKELRMLVPGFYFAIGNGNGADAQDTTDPIVRIYWHLNAGAAVQYMALATGTFNSAHIPFRTKVLADPAGYTRSDSGVLYLERKYFRPARRLISDIHRALGPGLRPGTPMFTRRLAEGVGVAEDPGNGLSFGQSRSNVIAKALWHCFVHGITAPEERLAAAAEFFRANGIDPVQPHLAAGSTDTYDLTANLPDPLWHVQRPGRTAPARSRNRKKNRN